MLIAQVAAAKQHFFHQVQPPRVVGVQFSVCHGGVLLGRNDWMMVVLPVQVMSGCPESLSCGLLSCAKNLFEQANFVRAGQFWIVSLASLSRPHHPDPHLRPVMASMRATAEFLDDLPQLVGVFFDDPQGFP